MKLNEINVLKNKTREFASSGTIRDITIIKTGIINRSTINCTMMTSLTATLPSSDFHYNEHGMYHKELEGKFLEVDSNDSYLHYKKGHDSSYYLFSRAGLILESESALHGILNDESRMSINDYSSCYLVMFVKSEFIDDFKSLIAGSHSGAKVNPFNKDTAKWYKMTYRTEARDTNCGVVIQSLIKMMLDLGIEVDNNLQSNYKGEELCLKPINSKVELTYNTEKISYFDEIIKNSSIIKEYKSTAFRQAFAKLEEVDK